MTEHHRDLVALDRQDAVAILTLNNPKRMNACGLAMRTQLYDHLLELESDESCRAVVLTGTGANFCAGGDVSEMQSRSPISARMRMDLPTRLFKLLVTGPKPIICAVEGNAFGCGVSFVAASDYAVAGADAKFSCAFIKVGLLPDFGGLWSIARRVGHRKAMEMCAFAETYSAQDAMEMQLINGVTEPGKSLERALEAAKKFAKNPPVAMALLRSALNSGNDTVDQAIATEIDYQGILQNTEEFADAVRAFNRKSKPDSN